MFTCVSRVVSSPVFANVALVGIPVSSHVVHALAGDTAQSIYTCPVFNLSSYVDRFSSAVADQLEVQPVALLMTVTTVGHGEDEDVL